MLNENPRFRNNFPLVNQQMSIESFIQIRIMATKSYIYFPIKLFFFGWCSHMKVLPNDVKLNILRLNQLVYKCYNRYNGVQILFVATVHF